MTEKDKKIFYQKLLE